VKQEKRPAIANLFLKAWGSVTTLTVLSLLVLFLVCYLRNIPFFRLLTDVLAFAWLALPIGITVITLLFNRARLTLSWLQAIALGCGVGLGVVPVVLIVLRHVDLWQYAFPTISAINLLAFLTLYYLKKRKKLPLGGSEAAFVLLRLSIGVVIFLFFYNYNNLHFTSSGDLSFRGLFGVDLPFFFGIVSGIRDTGYFADYHQLALRYSYHDFTYLLLAVIAKGTHSDIVTLVAHSSPLFTYLLALGSIFTFTLTLTNNKTAAYGASLGYLLLGSFTSTEQGTNALSISYVCGNIIFFGICTVLVLIYRSQNKAGGISILAILVLALTMALIKSKIPIYLVLETLFVLLLLISLIKKQRQLGFVFLLLIICSLLFLVLFGTEKNPLTPSESFVVGAPLLGYANHLSRILGIPLETINPVVSIHDIGILKVLLILPYSIFHFLRFAILDGRVLFLGFSLLLLRSKAFNGITAPESRDIVKGFLLLIPISFLLPVLYSPTWYPLAISFYTMLSGVAIAGILSVSLLTSLWKKTNKKEGAQGGESVAFLVGCLLLIGSFLGNSYAIIREVTKKPTVISKDYIQGMRYLRDHSSPNAIVATNRYDLDSFAHDESFYFAAGLSERTTVSAGAQYGALLGALQPIDTAKHLDPVQLAVDSLKARRAILDSIFLSTSADIVQKALSTYSIKFIVEDLEANKNMALNPLFVADSFFHNSSVNIWKVKYLRP